MGLLLFGFPYVCDYGNTDYDQTYQRILARNVYITYPLYYTLLKRLPDRYPNGPAGIIPDLKGQVVLTCVVVGNGCNVVRQFTGARYGDFPGVNLRVFLVLRYHFGGLCQH